MARDLSSAQYQALSEFRTQLRHFVHFSELTARDRGIEPQQYQLLLALRGLPPGRKPTVGELAGRLCIQPHSALELIVRLEKTGAIARRPGDRDKREVWIHLTAPGRALLRKIALPHRAEFSRSGPALAKALRSVLRAIAPAESHENS